MTRIAIIDYGMGNLHSIAKALEHVGGKDRVLVTSARETILAADRVVFPGVGAIRDCMAELQRSGLGEVVVEAVRSKPVLGVCTFFFASWRLCMRTSQFYQSGYADRSSDFYRQ